MRFFVKNFVLFVGVTELTNRICLLFKILSVFLYTIPVFKIAACHDYSILKNKIAKNKGFPVLNIKPVHDIFCCII